MPIAIENPMVMPQYEYKEDVERCEGADIPRAYTVSSIKHGGSLEVNETDLYALNEIERFLK